MEVFPWHVAARKTWRSALDDGRLAHGWLVEGMAGVGLLAFMEAAAAEALCEARAAGAPACGVCAGCRLIASGTHPDLMRVRPAAVALAEGATDDDDLEPAQSGDGGDGRKASREIKVEQVRALADFAAITPTRGGRRVALVYPADAMAAVAANALLKTLEEPTPGLVLLLATSALHRLLPTVRSRCRRLSIPKPPRGVALDWLKAQGQGDAARLDALGGAPLAVVEQADPGPWAVRAALVEALAGGARLDAAVAARAVETEIKRCDRERQAGRPAPVDLAAAVGWLQCFTHDAILQRLGGTLRYHRSRPALLEATRAVPIDRLLSYWRWLAQAASQSRHPVNALLFLEDCLLRWRALHH